MRARRRCKAAGSSSRSLSNRTPPRARKSALAGTILSRSAVARFAGPNSARSSSGADSAAHDCTMKGPARRALPRWIARATASVSSPGSAAGSTFRSSPAARRTCSAHSRATAEVPSSSHGNLVRPLECTMAPPGVRRGPPLRAAQVRLPGLTLSGIGNGSIVGVFLLCVNSDTKTGGKRHSYVQHPTPKEPPAARGRKADRDPPRRQTPPQGGKTGASSDSNASSWMIAARLSPMPPVRESSWTISTRLQCRATASTASRSSGASDRRSSTRPRSRRRRALGATRAHVHVGAVGDHREVAAGAAQRGPADRDRRRRLDRRSACLMRGSR